MSPLLALFSVKEVHILPSFIIKGAHFLHLFVSPTKCPWIFMLLNLLYSQVCVFFICVKRTLCCVNLVYTKLQGLNGKSEEITRSLDQRDGMNGI